MAVNHKLWIHVDDDINKRTNLYCLRIIILEYWFHDIRTQTRSICCLSFFFCSLLFSSNYRDSLRWGYCILSWRIQDKKCVKFTHYSCVDMCFCSYSHTVYDNIKHLGCASMDPSIPWRLHPTNYDWFNAWCSLSKPARFCKFSSLIK